MTREPLGRQIATREPLGRQIAEILRNEILVGNIGPDQHLTQQQICEEFGTSRMPVRDALLQLTYDGLVVDEGAGRVKVAQFSAQDLRDVYMVDAMLHGVACERVAKSITPGQLAELQSLHEQTKRAVESGDLEAVDSISWAFHRRINQLSDSTRLLRMMRSLLSAIPTTYVRTLPSWAPKMVDMQARLLTALGNGDSELARSIIQEHIRVTGNDFIDYLSQRGALAA